MDSTITRRSLLHRSAGVAGLALAGDLTGVFGSQSALAAHGPAGYGPLVADPAGILSLPKGFSYTVVAQAGVTTLESGEPTPSDVDGTAAFKRRGGGSVLVSNHEISGSEPFGVPHQDGLTYDETAHGGTTTVEVDGKGRRVRESVSLAGTHNNCAGGRTPWDTWLTCEETEDVLGKPHGFVFEVDPYAKGVPVPIQALGRFAHESVAIDPRRGTIYMTEDASKPNGLLYRWRADRRLGAGVLASLPADAGVVEAMQAYDRRGTLITDLSVATEPGTTYGTRWVTVKDRSAATVPVRKQFADSAITRSRKLEGMWWGDGGAYFTASFARPEDGSAVAHDGQVWFIDPKRETITLKLRFAYTPGDQDSDPDGPDNITVSAFGGVIMAEDGEGVQHLVGATERGETFFLARNDVGPENSEFAGPTFSHDHRVLFASVQTPGTTFAITGPFQGRGRR